MTGSIVHGTHPGGCFYTVGIPFFYLAALVNYETITKKTTRFCLSISPEEKLPLTLRFSATGETYKSLM